LKICQREFTNVCAIAAKAAATPYRPSFSSPQYLSTIKPKVAVINDVLMYPTRESGMDILARLQKVALSHTALTFTGTYLLSTHTLTIEHITCLMAMPQKPKYFGSATKITLATEAANPL